MVVVLVSPGPPRREDQVGSERPAGWPISVEGRHATRGYPLGVKVSDRELAAVRLRQHDWHGEWNSTVLPPLHSRNSKQSYRAETPLYP